MAKVSVKIDGQTIKAATDFVRVMFDIGNYVSQRRSGGPESSKLYNPYELLGLSPQATNEEIKQRYRQLAIVWHPDKQGGNEEAMKRLNKAYNEICEQRRLDKRIPESIIR